MNQIQKDNLRSKIKEYRKKLNLTQADLAKRIGYTKQAISNWETGKNTPSNEDIEKLAEIFGISVAALCESTPSDKNATVPPLELLEVEAIPNKIFTYVLFLKDNVNYAWNAWIYDMDYPTIVLAASVCAKCIDFLTFKEYFFEDTDTLITKARDFMDSKIGSEERKKYALGSRSAKEMLEWHEAFADNPEKVMAQLKK